VLSVPTRDYLPHRRPTNPKPVCEQLIDSNPLYLDQC
jgi:hypothetical protein